MTPRQRLLNTAAESYSVGEDEYIKDSEALRELDQLLSDMANCIKYDCERNNNGPVNKQLLAIELRLAQAGYGGRSK